MSVFPEQIKFLKSNKEEKNRSVLRFGMIFKLSFTFKSVIIEKEAQFGNNLSIIWNI